MTPDLLLAISHHLLVFVLAGLLVAELVWTHRGIDARGAVRIARIDAFFGVTALAVLVVGFLRVYLGAKGESFYLDNPIFWAKIGAFAIVGLLSIAPTLRFLHWSRAAKRDPSFAPAEADLHGVRRIIAAEAAIFLLIPTFAAVMARGIGLD